MKVKRFLSVLCVALAFVLCFTFVACNDTKDPTNTPDPGSKTEYTVTFDANGGTLTGNATVKVENGKTITGAPTAAKAEHNFEAWYTAAEGGEKIALDTYKVSKDVTLYAHYTSAGSTVTGVKVTFNANGGKFAGDKETIERTTDEDNLIFDADEPTRADHRFNGWYTAATGGEAIDPMFDEITASTTLYAQWIRQYTVTFNAGGGTLDGNTSVKVDTGTKIIGAPTVTKDGNDFYGWYTAAEDGEKIDLDTYLVGGDVTLYAKFGEFSMPLKVLKSTDGTANIGYTIEAEESKFNISEQMWWGWMGVTSAVENVATASGGKSLGYLSTAGDTITFTFKAATAGKAVILLRVTSSVTGGADNAIIDADVDNSKIGVTVNGTEVPYSGVAPGSGQPNVYNESWASVELGEFDLVAGTNTVVLTIKAQSCNLDCLDIKTDLTLTAVSGDAASGESTLPAPPAPAVAYEKNVTAKLIVVDHADGPAIDKAVLTFIDDIPAAAIATNPFTVGGMGTAGDKVYLSDAEGNKVAESVTTSKYVTIEYAYTYGSYGPNGNIKPFDYSQQTGRNTWKDISSYALTVKGLTIGETTYTKFGGEFTAEYEIPVLEAWDLTGTFTAGDITLKYASYAPAAVEGKTGNKPLIVWLHGAGEGGTDPTITLLGNQVVNLAKPLIQNYFVTDTVAGAYVLAPQSPTMWMDNGNGAQGGNETNSIYTETLFNLIKNFVDTHSDIDSNRIYVGGCSNGGFMTMDLLISHPDYFAAAYPIATPYTATAEEIAKIKNIPIWFTHAKADTTVAIGRYSTPENWWEPAVFEGYTKANTNQLYIDLLAAGATNVYYSLFDTVTITGDGDAATYMGHYSWIFTLRDECSKVQATTGAEGGAFTLDDLTETATNTVTLTEGGEAVTLWGWIAAQVKTAA